MQCSYEVHHLLPCGAESVAIAEDGSLYLPDRYGSILHATLDGMLAALLPTSH